MGAHQIRDPTVVAGIEAQPHHIDDSDGDGGCREQRHQRIPDEVKHRKREDVEADIPPQDRSCDAKGATVDEEEQIRPSSCRRQPGEDEDDRGRNEQDRKQQAIDSTLDGAPRS